MKLIIFFALGWHYGGWAVVENISQNRVYLCHCKFMVINLTGCLNCKIILLCFSNQLVFSLSTVMIWNLSLPKPLFLYFSYHFEKVILVPFNSWKKERGASSSIVNCHSGAVRSAGSRVESVWFSIPLSLFTFYFGLNY